MASPDSGTYWKSGVGWVSPESEYYSPPPSGPDVIKVTPPNTSGSFYEEKKEDKEYEPVTRGGRTYLVEKGTVTQKEEAKQVLPPTPPTLPSQAQPSQTQRPLEKSPFISPYDPRLPMPEERLEMREISPGHFLGPENMPISIRFEKGKGTMIVPHAFRGTISAGVEREQPQEVAQKRFGGAPVARVLKEIKEHPSRAIIVGGYAVAGAVVRSAALAYPPIGAGVLLYSGYQVAKGVREEGVLATAKSFTSPESLAFMAGAGSPRKGEASLFKVKTAGGAILSEVGAIKEGVKKVSVEVHPIDIAEYYSKVAPKQEPMAIMRGTERTRVIAKGAVADVTARVEKRVPTQLITEAPSGKGYPGTARLFEPAKQAENVNRVVQDIVKNIPKPSEEGLSRPAISGGVASGSKLSPVTQKLLDTTDLATGIQTKINAVKAAQEAGVSVKVPANVQIRALKEAGSGKVLSEARSVKGSFTYAGVVGGKLVAAKMAKRLQAGGTSIFEGVAKIEGKLPEIVYTKKGEYIFVSKGGKLAVPETMIIKAPGGWRGLKRTAFEAKKSVMIKAAGLKTKGQEIVNQIKHIGTKKPDTSLKYLSETYAKQNKIKTAELADKKYYAELEKKNAKRFEATARDMKGKEVKTASGQSLAQKTEQEFNRADYDKPVLQMVPSKAVISMEEVMPKPVFGVAGMVSETSILQGRTPQYQPRVSVSLKAYIPKERMVQETKVTPQLSVKQYESQIKLSSNIPTQIQKLGVEPILRQGVGSSIMQDVNVRQDIAQISVQVPRQKQVSLQISQRGTRQKLPPPEQKLAKTFFAGSESRHIRTSVKVKQSKLLSKKGKPWRLRLATWENVSITEAAIGKKAHHTLLKGRGIKEYDVRAYSQGASFRYPTAEQKRGLA